MPGPSRIWRYGIGHAGVPPDTGATHPPGNRPSCQRVYRNVSVLLLLFVHTCGGEQA